MPFGMTAYFPANFASLDEALFGRAKIIETKVDLAEIVQRNGEHGSCASRAQEVNSEMHVTQGVPARSIQVEVTLGQPHRRLRLSPDIAELAADHQRLLKAVEGRLGPQPGQGEAQLVNDPGLARPVTGPT